MAEIGSFRTGIGGFNKADVLNYIDELNARHGEEVEEARRELEEARTQLSAEQQKLEESDLALKQNAEQLSEALQTCKQQEERLAETEQLRQAAAAGDALRRENQELRDQLGGMRLLVDSAAEVQGRADEARIALEKERAERSGLRAMRSGEAAGTGGASRNRKRAAGWAATRTDSRALRTSGCGKH